MARTKAQVADALKAKQQKEVITPKGEINFESSMTLNSLSDKLTAFIKKIGKTKTGNFRYVATADAGHFKFYSKEELEDGLLSDHQFGIQVLDDGKELYWY
jgi:hypothetical protein